VIRDGHASVPKVLRVSKVPYINVSDLRAGLVNISPMNRSPPISAEAVWRSEAAGLHAFERQSPERASRSIGDFYLPTPGQE